MLRAKSQTNLFVFWILWVLSVFLGWTIYIYPGFNFERNFISSWGELFSQGGNLFIQVLLFGIFIGIVQYVLLRFCISISAWWIILSGISYASGAFLGLLYISITTWLRMPEIFSTHGQASLLFPLAFVMLIGGGITGVIQAYVLRESVLRGKMKILLWTLASSLAWGMGYYVSAFARGDHFLPSHFQNSLAGLTIGVITGSALVILMRDSDRKVHAERSLA